MPGDAEATLPALIEALKSAIPNDRKDALGKRGNDIRQPTPKGLITPSKQPPSPGTQARSAPHGC